MQGRNYMYTKTYYLFVRKTLHHQYRALIYSYLIWFFEEKMQSV